jgi:hypothetical protein
VRWMSYYYHYTPPRCLPTHHTRSTV